MTSSYVRALGIAALPAWLAGACAKAPPPAPPLPPVVPLAPDEKLAAIVRLEDHRILRDPEPTPPPAPVPAAGERRPLQTPTAVVPVKVTPDLTQLLTDPEARIRRRAALAIGRVRLVDGVLPLADGLKDPEVEVRQMAAFALGLIGDRSAVPFWLRRCRIRNPSCAAPPQRRPDPAAARPWTLGLRLLIALRRHPEFAWVRDGASLDTLCGTKAVRAALERGDPVDAILATEAPAIEGWRAERTPSLLY